MCEQKQIPAAQFAAGMTSSLSKSFGNRSVQDRRKENVPEVRGNGAEFHGDERAVRVKLRRTYHCRFDGFLSLHVLDRNLGSLRKRFRNDDQCTVGANRVRVTLENLRLADDVNLDSDPQEDALRAAALFRGQRARQAGLDVRSLAYFVLCRGLHSSKPQKSKSGATSSMPYSQPSGRGFPFHTTTAALLEPVARFVRATLCSREKDSGRTIMQPYGLTTRVCASSPRRDPAWSSHSKRTGTREFILLPRRFSE